MIKIFEVISVFFKRCFCAFSLLTLAYALVGKSVSTSDFSKYISVDHIFSFFLFSALVALSFAIADLIKNNNILRRCVQFVLTYLCVAVVFFAGGAFGNYVETNGIQNKGFSILAISFVFIIIYVVCELLHLVLSSVKKRLERDDDEYENMFDNKN